MALFTPKLQLYRTISNPHDATHVIGFEGRDRHFGRNARILKSNEIPTTGTFAGVLVYENDYPPAVYILGENTVYGLNGDAASDAPIHTFDETAWSYGRVSCPALKWEHFQTWDRNNVEVSN
jgi:hypothetical protein